MESPQSADAAFTFDIRRPLHSKEGTLYFDSGWRHFKLCWPTLYISEDENDLSASKLFPLHLCSVFPSPELDRSIGGVNCFCISVRQNRSAEIYKWFASSDHLRRQWCFLLRKHSVHHDLSNAFTVSSKKYSLFFLGFSNRLFHERQSTFSIPRFFK